MSETAGQQELTFLETLSPEERVTTEKWTNKPWSMEVHYDEEEKTYIARFGELAVGSVGDTRLEAAKNAEDALQLWVGHLIRLAGEEVLTRRIEEIRTTV